MGRDGMCCPEHLARFLASFPPPKPYCCLVSVPVSGTLKGLSGFTEFKGYRMNGFLKPLK